MSGVKALRILKRSFAVVLAVALLLTLCASADAASGKPGRPKVRNVVGFVGKKNVGLTYTWKAVPGADGYQYCYDQNYITGSVPGNYTVGTTAEKSVTVKLKGYGDVDFRVRAFSISGGRKVYGRWARCTLKADKVDARIGKQIKNRMMSYDLFIRMTAEKVVVRSGPGKDHTALMTYSRLDECRSAGKARRDRSGMLWLQIYAGKGQKNTFKGWVPDKYTRLVWY